VIEIEAPVFYWTPGGMSRRRYHTDSVGYIEVREVEQLLEQAHARGKRQGRELAEQSRGEHMSKFVLEVEKVSHNDVTRVTLKCQLDGSTLCRSFECAKDEAIHFTVLEGEIRFVSHVARSSYPPVMYGPSP
jgi:hypothetical protein